MIHRGDDVPLSQACVGRYPGAPTRRPRNRPPPWPTGTADVVLSTTAGTTNFGSIIATVSTAAAPAMRVHHPMAQQLLPAEDPHEQWLHPVRQRGAELVFGVTQPRYPVPRLAECLSAGSACPGDRRPVGVDVLSPASTRPSEATAGAAGTANFPACTAIRTAPAMRVRRPMDQQLLQADHPHARWMHGV